MAQLTTDECNGLHDAMLQAFPDRADLDQLLRLNLGESLPSIAPQGTTQRVAILDVITWFEAHGRITELVAAVHRARSRNILVTTITQAIRARLGDAEPMAVAQGPAPRHGLEAVDRQHPRRGRSLDGHRGWGHSLRCGGSSDHFACHQKSGLEHTNDFE